MYEYIIHICVLPEAYKNSMLALIEGLSIWLSRRLVVATTTKPNLGHLVSASGVA
jgi:hypothetical protein